MVGYILEFPWLHILRVLGMVLVSYLIILLAIRADSRDKSGGLFFLECQNDTNQCHGNF